jgi:hypothetical protein
MMLGWASTALTADQPGSGTGSASGSLPPAQQQVAPGGSCADGACWGGGCINEDCDPCCNVPGTGIIFSGGWHILRVNVNDNHAFSSTTAGATTATNFDYDFDSDYSLSAGYRGQCGLGATVSWFHLDNSANTLTTTTTAARGTIPAIGVAAFVAAVAPVGTVLTASSDITIDAWDFDVTQTVEVCRLDLTYGAGIRYLHVGQDINESAVTAAGAAAGRASRTNSYDGAGPTIVLNGLRRFGCSGFGVYANARGGLLFGDKTENASTTVGAATTSVTGTNDSTVGFAEIELGAHWGKKMGNMYPFARLGFEGRQYWGIGNAANATVGFATAPGIAPPGGNNSSPIGAYGIVLSGGIGF